MLLCHCDARIFVKGSLVKEGNSVQCRSGLVSKLGGQNLNHLTSHLNNVETCLINMVTRTLYFGSVKHFSPTRAAAEFKKL